MPNINISIKNKIAQQTNTEVIVCENSDYTAVFDFDDEWSDYSTKTARFSTANGYEEVAFTGTSCTIPKISDAVYICVGVYTGTSSTATTLHTTTPAFIQCSKSILSGGGTHISPTEDVYAQILALLNGFNASVSKSGDTATITITDPNGTTTASVADGEDGSIVSVSASGTATDEVSYITIDGVEKKLAGGSSTVDWDDVQNKPSTFPPSSHTHDDRYYTETEVDTALGNKANVSHTHTMSNITDLTAVAQSGDYDDLLNKPTIPSKTSDLTNDSGFYVEPSGGIPSTDMTSAVQTSLGLADTALQSHQSLSAYRTSADQDAIDSGKQATLVSGTNIKSINGSSILGSGNVDIDRDYELIDTITLSEYTSNIVLSTEPDGTSYNFKAIKLVVSYVNDTENTAKGNVYLTVNSLSNPFIYGNSAFLNFNVTTTKVLFVLIDLRKDLSLMQYTSEDIIQFANYATLNHVALIKPTPLASITAITGVSIVGFPSAAWQFPAGATIKVYAVRA